MLISYNTWDDDDKESHVSLRVWKLGCKEGENQLVLDAAEGCVAI